MSYPNRRHRASSHGQPHHAHQNDVYSSYVSGGGSSQVTYSERTPSSQGGYTENGHSRGGYTQNTAANTYYTERNHLEYSDRTGSSYSQGEYTRGGYTEGGHTQGGYTEAGHTIGGYTEGGHTRTGNPINSSDRTGSSYSQGEYTRGGYTEAGHTIGGYTEGGHTRTGYPINSSDRTGYTQGGTLQNSDRTPYSSGAFTGRDSGNSGSFYSMGSSYYEGGSFRSGPSQSGSRGGDMYSVGSAKRRVSNESISQLSASFNQQQIDNGSYCASTGSTTLAGGGRGRCPYQVEFKVQNQGKQISSTKRIIYFRYGFANEGALSQGRTGVECRGEEHDIVITWSITGGKRAISMDGREIKYSVGKRANKARRADILEASWRMSDHVYELRCYAYKPATGSPEKRDPKWRQYSLIVDGRSFFALPQIFDLGIKGLRPSMAVVASTQNDRQPNPLANGPTLSHPSHEPHPDQVKDTIQSRIRQQRKLVKERKQALSNEKKEIRIEHEKAKTDKSLRSDLDSEGVQSTGVESTGVQSTAVDSIGVHSAAPSELNEAKNRNYAAPIPAPKLALGAPQIKTAHEDRLTTHTVRTEGSQSGAMAGHPTPHQRQIQIQQNQNHQVAQTKHHARHPRRPPQNYQIEDKEIEPAHRAPTESSLATAGARRSNQPALTAQHQPESIQTYQSPTAQPIVTRGHQVKQSAAPQRPCQIQDKGNESSHRATTETSLATAGAHLAKYSPRTAQHQTESIQTYQSTTAQPIVTRGHQMQQSTMPLAPQRPYRIEDKGIEPSHHATTATVLATSEARPLNYSERTAQQQPKDLQTYQPPVAQQTIANGHQMQQSNLAFAPQQPPTYDEITRSIIGAYDDGSAVTAYASSAVGESSVVPTTGGAYFDSSNVLSNAGELSIVPRAGRVYDENSKVAGRTGESAMVLRAPNGFDAPNNGLDFNDRTSVSNLGHSEYPGENALVPAVAAKKLPRPLSSAQLRTSSSVDERGVNKWGYF